MHIITDRNEPIGAAIPIGNKVSAYIFDARYDSGMRAKTIEAVLCMNEMFDSPNAQKYPLKQKCIPAMAQSHT